MRTLLDRVIDLSIYERSATLPLVIAIYVLIVMLICGAVEWIRKNTLGKADPLLYKAFMHLWNFACAKFPMLVKYISGAIS